MTMKTLNLEGVVVTERDGFDELGTTLYFDAERTPYFSGASNTYCCGLIKATFANTWPEKDLYQLWGDKHKAILYIESRVPHGTVCYERDEQGNLLFTDRGDYKRTTYFKVLQKQVGKMNEKHKDKITFSLEVVDDYTLLLLCNTTCKTSEEYVKEYSK